MSSPLTYGIAANAEHADCAAFFFDWVATNEVGQINVDVGGSNPGGPMFTWRSRPSRRVR